MDFQQGGGGAQKFGGEFCNVGGGLSGGGDVPFQFQDFQVLGGLKFLPILVRFPLIAHILGDTVDISVIIMVDISVVIAVDSFE